jgi:uncharacterized membrane protein
VPAQSLAIWDYLGTHQIPTLTPAQQVQIELAVANLGANVGEKIGSSIGGKLGGAIGGVAGGFIALENTDAAIGLYGDAADALNTANDIYHDKNSSVIAQDGINDGFDVLNTLAKPVPLLSAGLSQAEDVGTATAENYISNVWYNALYSPK